jgi:hypothetical protein
MAQLGCNPPRDHHLETGRESSHRNDDLLGPGGSNEFRYVKYVDPDSSRCLAQT